MADAARDDAVRIAAREFPGIGTGVRVWCAIGIAFQSNSRYGDVRTCSKPFFQIVIFGLAFSQSEPPAIIMDHDADMIRIVESRCAAIERGIVEVPVWRSELPNELRKVVPVFLIAGPAAFRGKVVLVPPCEFSLWRQWHLAGLLAADQVPTHGDESLAALWPERRDDVGRPRAPIKTSEDRLLDPERIHQRDAIESDHRLLAIAEGVAGKKARRARAAQIRDDRPVARLRKPRRHVDIAVNIVGPAVQKHDRRTIGGTSFSVSDIQETGIDLLQQAEGRVRPRLHRGLVCWFCHTCLCIPTSGHAKLCRGKNHGRSPQKAAATKGDVDVTHTPV